MLGGSIAFQNDQAYISETRGCEKGNPGTCPPSGGVPAPLGAASVKRARRRPAGMYLREDPRCRNGRVYEPARKLPGKAWACDGRSNVPRDFATAIG